jgi:hypothetical protein
VTRASADPATRRVTTDRSRRPYPPKRTPPLAPDERQWLAIDKRLVLRLKREALNQEIDSDGDLSVSLTLSGGWAAPERQKPERSLHAATLYQRQAVHERALTVKGGKSHRAVGTYQIGVKKAKPISERLVAEAVEQLFSLVLAPDVVFVRGLARIGGHDHRAGLREQQVVDRLLRGAKRASIPPP